MIDINELRRLAQAATSGGWYVERGKYVYGCKDVTDGEEEWHPVIACTDDDETNVNFEGNAAFIAAANPTTILELLDRLEAAEKDVAIKEEVIDSLAAVVKRLDAQCDAAEKAVTEAYRRGYATGQEEIGAERDALRTMLEDERKEHNYTLRAAKAEAKQVDALRAKIEQMEKQAPVALVKWRVGGQVVHLIGDAKPGDFLYALPGTQPAPSVQDEDAAFRDWLNSEASGSYVGVYEFAKAAWMARAALEALEALAAAAPEVKP